MAGMSRLRSRVPRAVGALAVAALLFAGCSAATESGAAAETFVVATAGEPDALNPILGYGTDGASLIFDGLVARDGQNTLIPALAAELPVVAGTTVTAKLRAGVTFHDGTPLTAQDVVFTYRSVLDPKVDSTLR